MVWVLVLHISAVLLWCAALFYLPVLLCGREAEAAGLFHIEGRLNTVERLLFTHLATPLALVAIISGTAIFLLNRSLDSWLIVKLSLVAGLVVCHALLGLLVAQHHLQRQSVTVAQAQAQAQTQDASSGQDVLRRRCCWLLVTLSLLVTGILWIVLAKPALLLAQGG